MRVKLNAMDKITLLEAVAAVIVAPASVSYTHLTLPTTPYV